MAEDKENTDIKISQWKLLLVVTKVFGVYFGPPILFLILIFACAGGALVGAAFLEDAYWQHVLIEVSVVSALFIAVEMFGLKEIGRLTRIILIVVALILLWIAKFTPKIGSWISTITNNRINFPKHEYWEILLIAASVAIVLFIALEIYVKKVFREMLERKELLTSSPPTLAVFIAMMAMDEMRKKNVGRVKSNS